jgi:hypothetical protein
MARQGGRVQLQQSNMRLALNMATMAKEGFSCTTIRGTMYLIMRPCTEDREEKKRGVQFPGHDKMKVAIQRHPAMLHQNHMSGCLPCQNGTAKHLHTCWRRKGTGAPPPNQLRQQTAEPTPPQAGMPPAPTGITSAAESSQIMIPWW